jgi:hypothetical protein
VIVELTLLDLPVLVEIDLGDKVFHFFLGDLTNLALELGKSSYQHPHLLLAQPTVPVLVELLEQYLDRTLDRVVRYHVKFSLTFFAAVFQTLPNTIEIFGVGRLEHRILAWCATTHFRRF